MRTKEFTCLCLLLLSFTALADTIPNLVSAPGFTTFISTGIQDSLKIDSIGQPQRKPGRVSRFIIDYPQGSDTVNSIGQLQGKLGGRVAGVIRIDYPQGSDTIASVRETESNQKPQSSSKESKVYLRDAPPLNNYSFDLYHKVKNDKENILLSPLSTYYALLLTYEGSKNQTRQEFEKVLHLEGVSGKAMDSLLLPLTDKQQGYHISNVVWTDKETAASDINRWISEKTNNKIREAINSSDIKDSTSIVIANTVYFKGEWKNKFDKEKTKSGTFFASAENQYKIAFMHISETIPYYENDLFQFISKPYRDSHLSFCVILPKALFGIEEIEEKMNADLLKGILDEAQPASTMVSIPKLKLESNWKLSNALKEMGITSAFSDSSDFSAISDSPLALENIIHNTVIELDEEKTEAAAATATTFFIRGLPSYHVFKADHPFMFFVIDNQTKVILFMGKYSKPTDGVALDKDSLASNLEKRKDEKFYFGNTPQKLLFVIDEKIQTQADFNTIKPKDIKSFSMIKDKEKIREYTSEDYEAAIIITLKDSLGN